MSLLLVLRSKGGDAVWTEKAPGTDLVVALTFCEPQHAHLYVDTGRDID